MINTWIEDILHKYQEIGFVWTYKMWENFLFRSMTRDTMMRKIGFEMWQGAKLDYLLKPDKNGDIARHL